MLNEKRDADVRVSVEAVRTTQLPLEPRSAAARELYEAAQQHHRAGRLADAERLYVRVLSIEPHHADSLHLLGVLRHQCGLNEQAVDLISTAVRSRDNVAQYHSNLGNALAALQRHDDAIASYQRALALSPVLAETHCNLATLFAHRGKLAEAVDGYRKALEINPDLADAHVGLGALRLYQGMIEEAITCYERALALDSSLAEVHNGLGWAYHLKGRFADALRCYERALAIDPGLADACNNMGFTLQALGRSEPAIACYERALTADSGFAEAANNLGNALKECGQFERAMASYDRALAIRPHYLQAHFNRADLKTFRPADPDLQTLERLAESSEHAPAANVPFIHFALAKALDDIGETDRAFQHLLLGNSLKRRQLNHDQVALADFFQRIRRVFDRELLERCAHAGEASQLPIFVVGMPRSGSTLVEQILSCHPQVQSAGERNDLERVIADELNASPSSAYPEFILQAAPSTLRRMGSSYLARLPALRPGRNRIIDKLPGNFMHVGLIRTILPNARIIHVIRDPLDTCLSCFSKLFREGQEFSYDLAELGRYYRQYSELMQHWRRALPANSVYEVSYERVVADLPTEVGRMLAYCGLDWDDRCLEFHTAQRVVGTASAVQVRKPLYKSSVQRSKRYLAHLQPLIAALEA